MEIYSETHVKSLVVSRNRWMIISSIVLSLSLGLLIASWFVVNDTTIIAWQVIDAVILSLSLSLFVFSLLNHFIRKNNQIKHIDKVIKGEKKEEVCSISEIGKLKTMSRDIKATPIIIASEEGPIALYVASFLNVDISIGKTYRIKHSSNYVIEIEEVVNNG
ncbi:MAG: hypothetical protein IJ247_01020 [Bacilli bacterium]|nr:hypothetical protein [Bacilli bacterium]